MKIDGVGDFNARDDVLSYQFPEIGEPCCCGVLEESFCACVSAEQEKVVGVVVGLDDVQFSRGE